MRQSRLRKGQSNKQTKMATNSNRKRAVSMNYWPPCRSERPAFLSSFLALTLFTPPSAVLQQAVFLRESGMISVGLLRSAVDPPVLSRSSLSPSERAPPRSSFLLSWRYLVSLSAVLMYGGAEVKRQEGHRLPALSSNTQPLRHVSSTTP